MLKRLNRLLKLANWAAFIYCAVVVMVLFWPMSGWSLALICWIAWKRRRPSKPTDLGSARWADTKDLTRAGMLGASRGLILGRLPNQRRNWLGQRYVTRRHDPIVRLTNAVHCAIFAPTGAGKGVSIVLPSLLTDPQSMVVLDFKGELARETAEYRRKRFGHRAVLLDPYHVVTNQPDTFNPLDGIQAGHSLAIDDANDLAAAIIVRTGHERERHWDDLAELCVAAVTATVVTYGEPHTRSLQHVQELLSHPTSFEMTVKLMTGSDAWGGALARLGGQLLHLEGKEKASVLSSTLRHLRFLGTPSIAASTTTSSFDPMDLRRGKMTVYCILPPDRAAAQAGLLRMWVSSMMRACMRGGLQ